MAQGVRTLNGYVNNYPVLTSLSGTAVWNTDYKLGSISALSFTVPAYATTDGASEIRICFTASANITAAITTSNFTTKCGFADISISSGKSYELSIIPLSATVLTCVCKEWEADA